MTEEETLQSAESAAPEEAGAEESGIKIDVGPFHFHTKPPRPIHPRPHFPPHHGPHPGPHHDPHFPPHHGPHHGPMR